MMQEINLLTSLPKTKRNVQARAQGKDEGTIDIARSFGRQYFDGDRKFGYGGYKYDGRWQPVAIDLLNHYDLWRTARVLDIGCAKGFLVKDIMAVSHGVVQAFGADISEYALAHCEPEVVGRLHNTSADFLDFIPDHSFDLVVSINTLHNLPRERLIDALKQITRISKGPAYVVVDSFYNAGQKAVFEEWVLTAQWYGYPDEWLALFAEAGYKGDYSWTIVE